MIAFLIRINLWAIFFVQKNGFGLQHSLVAASQRSEESVTISEFISDNNDFYINFFDVYFFINASKKIEFPNDIFLFIFYHIEYQK